MDFGGYLFFLIQFTHNHQGRKTFAQDSFQFWDEVCKYKVTSRLKDFVPSTTLGPSLGTLFYSSHRLHLLLLPHIFCIFNIKCHSMQIYSHIECKGMITIMILKLLSFQKGSSISQGHIVLPLNICF